MKHLEVSCAIIENGGKVFSAQRSEAMSLPLKWEFPGGKINDGENPAECLKRELYEELGIEIVVGQRLSPVKYHYPTFSVTLYPFICIIVSGEITLHEHAAIDWLTPEELHMLDWAEADLLVLEIYREILKTPLRGSS